MMNRTEVVAVINNEATLKNDLKTICKEMGLAVGGTKAKLVESIKAYLDANQEYGVEIVEETTTDESAQVQENAEEVKAPEIPVPVSPAAPADAIDERDIEQEMADYCADAPSEVEAQEATEESVTQSETCTSDCKNCADVACQSNPANAANVKNESDKLVHDAKIEELMGRYYKNNVKSLVLNKALDEALKNTCKGYISDYVLRSCLFETVCGKRSKQRLANGVWVENFSAEKTPLKWDFATKWCKAFADEYLVPYHGKGNGKGYLFKAAVLAWKYEKLIYRYYDESGKKVLANYEVTGDKLLNKRSGNVHTLDAAGYAQLDGERFRLNNIFVKTA